MFHDAVLFNVLHVLHVIQTGPILPMEMLVIPYISFGITVILVIFGILCCWKVGYFGGKILRCKISKTIGFKCRCFLGSKENIVLY